VSNIYKNRGKDTSATPWWMKDDEEKGKGTSGGSKSFIKQPKAPIVHTRLSTSVEVNEEQMSPSQQQQPARSAVQPAKKTTTFKLDHAEEKRYSEEFEDMPKLSLDNQSSYSSYRQGLYIRFLMKVVIRTTASPMLYG
jgi:hypothetical protein